MIFSTGDIQENYKTLDVIFAFDSVAAGFFSSTAKPEDAFKKVSQKLLKAAKEAGADGVIHCKFDYRIAVANGLFGAKQAVEFFAYGTLIKLT